MREERNLNYTPLPEVPPKQLLKGVELLPDHGGESSGFALKEEHKHVNLTEGPDYVADISGEHTAAVLGVLHALSVDDSDTLIGM